MDRLVFQGDSVTDCDRGEQLGNGYVNLIAAQLGYENPGMYEIMNMGIGGNRSTDLLARWKRDCINLKPDCLTLLIGINDIWHELGWAVGTSKGRFEEIYTMLLSDVKDFLPDTRIILMEPFVTEGKVLSQFGAGFRDEVRQRNETVHNLAMRFSASVVELCQCFDKVCSQSSPQFWTRDGVHPTPAGHELIKREWLKVFMG